MATPTFRALARSFPDSCLVLVIRASVAAVLRGSSWFEHIITYERDTDGPCEAIFNFLRCSRTLHDYSPQLGVLLPHSFSSALMFRLAGIEQRTGYQRDARSFLLTDAVDRPTNAKGNFQPSYMVDYYLRLCEHLEIPVDNRNPELRYTEHDRETARLKLRRAGIDPAGALFLFHPAAGYGPAKLWSLPAFAQLAAMLAHRFDAQIGCIGAPPVSPIARKINRLSETEVLDLTRCGIDLHLLKCVVAWSDLLVTTDSGPRHYGVALGTPTVCVMGPTHPAYSTSGRPHDHVVRVDVKCGPCQKKVCPRDHRCMKRITPQMVFNACEKALKETPHRK